MPKKISIVIPCYNEEKYISGCIESLINNDYPEDLKEIIIVDGQSTDSTKDILAGFVSKYKFIKIINNPLRITPAAMNTGITHATGDLIMIASSHSAYPTDYISGLIKYKNKLNADVIGGIMKTGVKNSNPKSNSIVRVLSSRFGVGNSMFRIGVTEPMMVDTVPFGIYNKKIFQQVGLYNELLIRNHDIELSKRIIAAAYKIYLVPDIECLYFARESFTQLSKNNYRNGIWNVLTLYITGNFKSLSIRHYIPLLFILSLIIPLVASIFIKSFWVLSVTSFVIYTAFILYNSVKLNDGKTKLIYLIWGYIVLHFSYGIGSLAGLVRLNKLFAHK